MASRSGSGKTRRKRKPASELNSIYDWTPDDERLSGLPDPTPTVTVDPEALAAWEKDFYTAIANDPVFWEERADRLGLSDKQEDTPKNIASSTEYDGGMLTEILQADMGLITRLLYLASMMVIYCFIVLPFHIIIWAIQALRRYYHERCSMGSDQDDE
jgi:hypothetical protein